MRIRDHVCRAAPSSSKEYREVYAGEAHTGEVQCFKVVYDSSGDVKEVGDPVPCDSSEAFFKGSSYTGFMMGIKEMYCFLPGRSSGWNKTSFCAGTVQSLKNKTHRWLINDATANMSEYMLVIVGALCDNDNNCYTNKNVISTTSRVN